MFYKFKILSSFLDIEHLKIIYYSLIEARLHYGIIGWGEVTDVFIRKLQVAQRRILKIIYRKPIRFSTDMLFNELKILDIRQIYFYNLMTLLFHNHNTRFKANFSIKTTRSNKTIGQRSSCYLLSRAYNFLPKELYSKSI